MKVQDQLEPRLFLNTVHFNFEKKTAGLGSSFTYFTAAQPKHFSYLKIIRDMKTSREGGQYFQYSSGQVAIWFSNKNYKTPSSTQFSFCSGEFFTILHLMEFQTNAFPWKTMAKRKRKQNADEIYKEI